jgi:protein SCO1/2
MDAPMSPRETNPKQAGKRQHGRDGPNAKASGAKARPSASPKRNVSPTRLILLGLGLALMIGLGLLAMRPQTGLPPGGSSGVAAVGGPFRMVDVDGRPVDESLLRGKWSAVFFGFTYCPDICPATMTALAAAKRQMPPDKAAQLQTVFVSVDPERDTPAQLKAYLSTPAFPTPIIGLTGSAEQVKAIAGAYRVYYAKSGEGPGYLMDHNSAIYLMNPQGLFVRLIRPDAKPQDMAHEIGGAMGRS